MDENNEPELLSAMKISSILRRLLALASLTLVTSTGLFGAEPANEAEPTPHAYAIASGKMTDAAKAATSVLGPQKDGDPLVFVDGNYLIVGARGDQMGKLAEAISPYLESASKPFDLEIRNGHIIENGKSIGDATVGSVLDYLKLKKMPFNVILKPGVADIRINDLVLHQPNFDDGVLLSALGSSVEDEVNTSNPSPGIFMMALRESNEVRQTQVFNLTRYLNPNGDADEKAIQEKLMSLREIIGSTLHDLNPNTPPSLQPNFQFHQGANLLVVVGTTDAITVANQVVNALQPEDGNPSAPSLKNVAQRWADVDPAAALAWVQSLPDSNKTVADGSRRAPDLTALYNLFAQMRNLQDGTPGKPLSPQEIQDFEKQMVEMQKVLNGFQKLLPKENPPATSTP